MLRCKTQIGQLKLIRPGIIRILYFVHQISGGSGIRRDCKDRRLVVLAQLTQAYGLRLSWGRSVRRFHRTETQVSGPRRSMVQSACTFKTVTDQIMDCAPSHHRVLRKTAGTRPGSWGSSGNRNHLDHIETGERDLLSIGIQRHVGAAASKKSGRKAGNVLIESKRPPSFSGQSRSRLHPIGNFLDPASRYQSRACFFFAGDRFRNRRDLLPRRRQLQKPLRCRFSNRSPIGAILLSRVPTGLQTFRL